MFPHERIARLLILIACSISTSALAIDRMVDMGHPNAQDIGIGSRNAPYKTLAYAMSQLRPGDHLTIASGTYREALIFPINNWSRIDAKLIASGNMHLLELAKDKETLIEGKGEVLIKGSDLVTDWQELGNGRFSKTWPEETQQVFIDGIPLQQIGGTIFDGFPVNPTHVLASLHQSQNGIWPGRQTGDENSMPKHSFYYDRATRILYLQTNLAMLEGHTVEVSVRPILLSGNGVNDIQIKHLNFQHANTSTRLRSGLVSMTGIRLTLVDIHVKQADSIGIVLIGNDLTLRNSSANQCGQLGIMGRGERMQLINNETNDNNTRGFNKWWEAGGAKFVGNGGLQDSLVSEHQALRNKGDGIWFDWKNRKNTIQNSLSAFNAGFGIHYEASDQGRIIHNVVVANDQRGIYLSQSSDSLVAFNLVAANKMQGIAVIDEGRRDPKSVFDFSANGNHILANVIAWNTGAIVLPSNQAHNISDHNVLIGDDSQTRAGQGWLNMFMASLQDWSKRTQQDLHTHHIRLSENKQFRESISAQRNLNLDWYRDLRKNFKPIIFSPALQNITTDISDKRAGPALTVPIQD